MHAAALNLSKMLIKLFIIGLIGGFCWATIWYFLNVPAEIGRIGTPALSAFIFFTKLRKWATC